MKKLEEMNLLDDFLANSVMNHATYGKPASRYILECIFQRKIGNLMVMPQRTYYGDNEKCHGIRLDIYLDEENGSIYDIEPDQNGSKEDRESLPRRGRFYHAKLDGHTLEVGEDYGQLRDVVVVFITSYDPFSRNRMVYTIKNRCVEAPDMPYEDGATTLYLYTKGEEGNPPEELKSLLRYMEHSSIENVSNEGLESLHHMVTEVKRDGEVGLAYMKSFEIEKKIREEGREEGREEERQLGVRVLIATCREFGLSNEQIKTRIEEQFSIDQAQAEQYLTALG